MAGLEPVTFQAGSGEALSGTKGLVLCGGNDVDPSLYGATPAPETNPPNRARDDYESDLVRTAVARDLPVLAICRGQQLFNVARGGTLIQHLPASDKHKQNTGGKPVHAVSVSGRLAEIFGASRLAVNSRHHQAIDRAGDGMIIAARDPEDGVVEGFAVPSARFAVGVQWHPEDMTDDPYQLRLFSAFAGAVRAE
jgi:gamma-glutamyl-gamma-aminobutyrate hydrolase PuuD